MSYTLTIDDAGFSTLGWLESRGYDCGLLAALVESAVSGQYTVAEHLAWGIAEAAECVDSGFACLDWQAPIGIEIKRFLGSVV